MGASLLPVGMSVIIMPFWLVEELVTGKSGTVGADCGESTDTSK